MPDERRQTFQDQTEVIALPLLRMVLVHAKEERENALTAMIKSAEPQENVEPQDLKKIIEHLKKKDRS